MSEPIIGADDIDVSATEGLLGDEETSAILAAAISGTGRPLSFDEARQVVRWAERVRSLSMLLQLVLSGQLVIVVADSREPLFQPVP